MSSRDIASTLAPWISLDANFDNSDGSGSGSAGAVLEDMEEEMYNTAYLVQSLNAVGVSEDDGWAGNETLRQTIKDASKGVTEGTHVEYVR